MKKLTLWMLALATFQGSALQAQNITGNWQGTLQAGQQKLRIIFKIALENDNLKATLYSIDQPSPPYRGYDHTGWCHRKNICPLPKRQLCRKAERRRKLDRGDVDPGRAAALEPGTRHSRDRLGHSGTSTSAGTDGAECESRI
jgi:hypothetical protein